MKVMLKNIDKPNYDVDIDNYIKEGGYEALKKALKMTGEEIINEIKTANLLGRGGAYFPAWIKWDSVRKEKNNPKYVVCNADEGEPGTFKDRVIIEQDSHQLVEAMTIAGYAVGAKKGFIYIRGEFFLGYKKLLKAIEEAKEKNYLGNNILGSGYSYELVVYRGAGAYICGEETALLDSLEGKKGRARLKPPFPTIEGYDGKPTLINNVETLANVPAIILNGGNWYNKIGSPDLPGTKLYCLLGDINKPGVYELPTNVTLRDLIEKHGGGVKGGKLKAILPGGVSSKFITVEDLDFPMSHKHLCDRGSMLGSAAVLIINDKRNIADLALNCSHFFLEESCGQCNPCREGTLRSNLILQKLIDKKAENKCLDLLKELDEVMFLTCRCGLGQVALNPVISGIEKFYDDFKKYLEN